MFPTVKKPKYLIYLSIACYLFLAMTILFQNRIIVFGSQYITGALFVYPFSYFILDLITEVYGANVARRVLWLSIISFIILTAILKLVIVFSPQHFINQDFVTTVTPMLKVAIVDGIGIVIGQLVNIYALTKLSILSSGRFFPLRSATSTIVGDAVTCLIAIFGVFIEHVSIPLMLNIVITELLVMFVFAAVLATVGDIFVYILRKAENIDVNKSSINYNPFINRKKDKR